ncbi:MAG: hypothetical protein R3314_04100 [Longimicrobiales bacterium]|nr:hypothetical protein [Longimicrobiales bacterium]
MSPDLQPRLDDLERRHRRLVRGVWAGGILVAAVAAAGFTADQEPGVIRATEVVIEDPNGVVRARLGGDLPDAEYDGRTVDRGSAAAGLMLYDTAGDERGGYVTMDGSNNILLTLDAGAGGGHGQTAYFVANESGATALRIWSGGDHVELRVGSDGGAWFNAVEDGVLVSQTPTIENPAETAMCTELRGLIDRAPMDRLMDACRQRMTEDGCRACLEGAPEGGG